MSNRPRVKMNINQQYDTRRNSVFLYSTVHTRDPKWCTHIQIRRMRFRRLERFVDWILLWIFRPKLTKDNLELIKLRRRNQ